MTTSALISTHKIKILSLPIEIKTNHQSFLREFRNLTSTWVSPADGETPAVRFMVLHKRRLTHIEKDGITLYRLDKDFQLCPVLMDQIRMSCYENVRDYVLFHSGAVVKNGRAILLPARSESGKTTLTLGLMNYGYQYLTDEVAVVNNETLDVIPYQRPIFVWHWSRPLCKDVSRKFRIYRYSDSDNNDLRWQYIVPRDGAVIPRDGRWGIDLIIFPRYIPKTKTVLKRIGTAQAVVFLMQNCWNQALIPDGGLKICIGLARSARCYTLEMGSLEKACELIENLQEKDI